MAQYDPQRSHSRHRRADDEGPAPVDALLGPDPAPDLAPDPPPVPAPAVAAARPDRAEATTPGPDPAGPWIDPRPGPDHVHPSGRPVRRAAVMVAALVALIVVLWVGLRRRAPGGPIES